MLEFHCPNCNSMKPIEEVSSAESTISLIEDIVFEEDGPVCKFGPSYFYGDVHTLRYQCSSCGWTFIRDSGLEITEVEDLVNHLKLDKSLKASFFA